MSFVKKASLLGVSELLMAIGSVGSSVIFSRYLGPDGVGQFAVFLSLLGITVPLVSLGIGRANIYFLNSGQFERRQVVGNSLVVGLLMGSLLVVGMTACLQLRPDYFGEFPLWVLFVFSLGVGCQVLIALLRPVLVAALASKQMLSVDVMQRGAIIVGALVIALAGVLAVDTALCIRSVATLFALALLLYFLRNDLRKWPTFELDWFRETASYGLKIAAGGIMFTLTSSATVLIIRYQLPEDFASVGFYTRAVTISGFVVLVPRAMSPLFYAKWADRKNTDRGHQIERAARFNVFYGALSAVGLVILGRYAILILYGTEFLPAYPVLVVFAPAMVFICLFSIFNSLLASDGRAATTARILAMSMLLVCSLTYLSVPTWGIYGAALAVLCGNVLSTVLMAVACCHQYPLSLRRMLLIKPADFRYLKQALSR